MGALIRNFPAGLQSQGEITTMTALNSRAFDGYLMAAFQQQNR
jgi:hypothetical protein